MKILCKLFDHKWKQVYRVDVNLKVAKFEYVWATICKRCGNEAIEKELG